MATVFKRPKPAVKDKFLKAQDELNNELRLNKDNEAVEFNNRIMKSKLAPVIQEFYINHPIVPVKKTPYYTTASFKKGIMMLKKALNGTLFNDTEFRAYQNRKFTIDEILMSIQVHKKALDPDYKPVDKSFLHVALDRFLFNPYAKSIGRSFLIYWMTVDPMPITKPKTDCYPEVTEEVIRLFEWHNLTQDDMNNIVNGVSLFKELLSKVQISPIFRMTPKKEAEILWVIVTDVFEYVGKSVRPRNLVSPKFKTWIEEGLKNSDYVL